MKLRRIPDRIRSLSLPERLPALGQSLRDAERELEGVQYGGELLDLTYANTHRFPPPPGVLTDFVAAASGGGMTYTPYRGDERVRSAVAESLSGFLGIDVDPNSELILTPGSQNGRYLRKRRRLAPQTVRKPNSARTPPATGCSGFASIPDPVEGTVTAASTVSVSESTPLVAALLAA
jgi:hypothetical protein